VNVIGGCHCTLAVTHVRQCNVGAHLGKRSGNRAPDISRTARDERDFSGQIHRFNPADYLKLRTKN
jgi:hypothetical protein